MKLHRGPAILFATAAIVFGACSSGGASTAHRLRRRCGIGRAHRPPHPRPRRHRLRLRRPSRRRSQLDGRRRHHRLVARPEQRPGQEPVAEAGGRVHGRPSERHGQAHRPRERGVQDEAHHPAPGGHPARPVPVVGRRRPRRAGEGRPRQGHHRRRRVVDERDQPRRHGHVPGRRQAVRHPVRPRHGRLLVQQGRSSPRPASRPRRRPGTSSWPTSASSRPPASRRSPSPARTRGPGCSTGPTSRSARVARRDGQGDHDRRLERTELRQGRRASRSSSPTSRSRKASSPPRGTAPAAVLPRWRPGEGAMQLMGQWLPAP